jgi:UDP-N-acetylmuramoyl-L-alanyl-D-glutamate--2,6-diaminopimelate ligase
VTSDNPRSEDPAAIVAEILAGVESGGEHTVEVIVERRAAIARAISLARSGDVVMIAGKGHEQGQEFARGRKVAFDDAAVAREHLRPVEAHAQ